MAVSALGLLALALPKPSAFTLDMEQQNPAPELPTVTVSACAQRAAAQRDEIGV